MRTTSALFNVKTYARDMEKVFKQMWAKYEAGKPVDHVIDVQD